MGEGAVMISKLMACVFPNYLEANGFPDSAKTERRNAVVRYDLRESSSRQIGTNDWPVPKLAVWDLHMLQG
jgi:hypothetical protein